MTASIEWPDEYNEPRPQQPAEPLDYRWAAYFWYSDTRCVKVLQHPHETASSVISDRATAEVDRRRQGDPERFLVRFHFVAPDHHPMPTSNPFPTGTDMGSDE